MVFCRVLALMLNFCGAVSCGILDVDQIPVLGRFMCPLTIAGESGRYCLAAVAINPNHVGNCLLFIALMSVLFVGLKRH